MPQAFAQCRTRHPLARSPTGSINRLQAWEMRKVEIRASRRTKPLAPGTVAGTQRSVGQRRAANRQRAFSSPPLPPHSPIRPHTGPHQQPAGPRMRAFGTPAPSHSWPAPTPSPSLASRRCRSRCRCRSPWHPRLPGGRPARQGRREARERVRAAFSAMGLSLPPRRLLINLKPADLLKEGSHFDLPLALGVLAAWTCCRAMKSPATPRWRAVARRPLNPSPGCCPRRSARRGGTWG